MKSLRSAPICVLSCLFLAEARSLAQPSFVGMGVPPGAGSSSTATDVSADGASVVGYTWDGTFYTALRWRTPSGSVPINVPFCPQDCGAYPSGVSGDGSTVVGIINRRDEAEYHPFRWTQEWATTWLGPLTECPNASWGFVGVADDGLVVAGYALGCNGYRWTEELGVTELGTLAGCTPYSIPYGISGGGRVIVGGCYYSGLTRSAAFRWTESEGMVALGDLPGGEVNSVAWDASYDGGVIVGRSNSGNNASARESEAFVWKQPAGITPLGDLPGGAFDSSASGVSADGSVIVGYGTDASGRRAFIWTAETGMRNLRDVLVDSYALDLAGWTLTEAVRVSADGRVICGNGINPGGFREAWVASLGACPGDFNHSGSVDSQDFFDFLDAFFADAPAADFNQDSVINSQDFFDFLTEFFGGCR